MFLSPQLSDNSDLLGVVPSQSTNICASIRTAEPLRCCRGPRWVARIAALGSFSGHRWCWWIQGSLWLRLGNISSFLLFGFLNKPILLFQKYLWMMKCTLHSDVRMIQNDNVWPIEAGFIKIRQVPFLGGNGRITT